MQKYFLEISYLGTQYSGWQVQANAVTVQERINLALETLLRHGVNTLGSGRTDAGVHARQQFVQFETDQQISDRLIGGLNALLPDDIAAKHVWIVPQDASARFDALSRKYIYRISEVKNPFYKSVSYFFPHRLDIKLMNEASAMMLSYNEFGCFCKSNSDAEHYLCDIKECRWEQTEELLLFHVKANRFLRGMVRGMVGTLFEVGLGRMSLTNLAQVLESQDRTLAGRNVPAEGLTLEEVEYPEGYLKKI